jgi:hypothetical protein
VAVTVRRLQAGQNCSSGAFQYATVARPPGRIMERPRSLAFGTVTHVARVGSMITLANTGTVAVSIFSISIVPDNSGSNAEFHAVSVCPASLAPGRG